MASTIKVDNVQNQPGTNIVSKCGTDVTIGASGDTVALASGASQTGFGRTGTVDWQTGSIKTATFTAANGEGYFCNTAGGAFEMDLPAGSAGAIVSVQDYNNTFDSNTLTVDPNGSEKINGGDAGGPLELTAQGQGITLVYVDSTVGWRSVQENEYDTTGLNPALITATGGTPSCGTICGDYKIHTFTGPGTFCVSAGNGPIALAEYMVIAGGGGGGGGYGGGAGGGGFRYASPSLAPVCYPGKPLTAPDGIIMTPGPYSVSVGGGGSGATSNSANDGTKGVNSVFAATTTITSAGGGVGASHSPNCNVKGGSGGGGTVSGPAGPATGGVGNTPPVSPAQGTNGGDGYCGGDYGQGGGGGAIAVGVNGTAPAGGDGGEGAGIPTGFGSNGVPCGSYQYYAGGGGGGRYGPSGAGGGGGTGGKGGGGSAGQPSGVAGTTNTGGGGGAGNGRQPCGHNGGNGGSGIVVIRYKFQ